MDFKEFSIAINEQFNKLASNGRLLHAKIGKDQLWDEYLKAFPEGTNPIYIENTVHDCNCCKGFLRQVGNVVVVLNGNVHTLWDDYQNFGAPYDQVAKRLRTVVLGSGIDRVFKPTEPKYGADITYTIDAPEKPRTFNHFHCDVPEKYHLSQHDRINSISNNFTPALKSLEEITIEAVDTVIELIESSSLYRGNEHLEAVKHFKNLIPETTFDDFNLDLYVWENIDNFRLAIRNTVIGSLLKDLSDNMDLEKAVKRFEDKVAPHNYKRPKALITQGMIDKATAAIEELGLEPALYRRHARPSDVSVNDILFVDRSVKKEMKDGLLDQLKPQKNSKAGSMNSDIGVEIETFIKDVLPGTKKLEVLFDNRHTSNLVNIFAAVNEDAPPLFKWNNQFSWGYKGGVADSAIKQAVSKAGGDVTGEFRLSLGWHDSDDLDLHLRLPVGAHLHYGNKHTHGGSLDVDMNAERHNAIDPVENITWPYLKDLPIGRSEVFVHNYTQRSNSGKGFTVELEVNGDLKVFTYAPQLQGNRRVICFYLEFDGKDVRVVDINADLSQESASKDEWGIQTKEFHQVSMMTLSPNHWYGEQGNKHYMFMLKGCLNPEKTRGIYNEFLRDELTPNRKVFEVLGNRSLCEYSEDQLAGLGFSSTKRDTLQVKVDGRPFCIIF